MSPGKADFPKQARLRKRPEFIDLSRRGKKIHTPHFVVITRPNDGKQARLGVTVSAKVGNAVARNRVKRLVRECFRRCRRDIVPVLDVLVIARDAAADISYAQTESELKKALVRNGSR
ncbi:MAG TPA: ribonuclease P protein component [candidate division Zixibacteria bacterium]|nr:ribonuclease P protein component [candidate division Zixibacteria bacterium]